MVAASACAASTAPCDRGVDVLRSGGSTRLQAVLAAARVCSRFLGFGVVAGALAGASQWWAWAVPLQPLGWLIALLPMAFGCGMRRALLVGVGMVAAYAAFMLPELRLPTVMSVGLVGYLGTVMLAQCAVAAVTLRRGSLAGALAAAAGLTLLEWANISLYPVFGTAQCPARSWSLLPSCIQFVALTGILGVVLVQGLVAACGAVAIAAPGRRRAALALMAAIIGAVAIVDGALWSRRPTATVTLGAVGYGDLAPDEAGLARQVEDAAARGARVIATPECSLEGGDAASQAALLARWAQRARSLGVVLALGYYDSDRHNRVALIGADGDMDRSYAKEHLVPGMESYPAGDGTLALLQIGAAGALGTMVCQDDNFTDLSRGYGRAGAAAVAVPTNDWPGVHQVHLQSSVHRALESRYAVIRAASRGISAIISPRGEVLARRDHLRDGAGVVVAEVELAPSLTPYARCGDWIALALSAAAAAPWLSRCLRRARG
jgi:apolipoprotein N-acyltransferase